VDYEAFAHLYKAQRGCSRGLRGFATVKPGGYLEAITISWRGLVPLPLGGGVVLLWLRLRNISSGWLRLSLCRQVDVVAVCRSLPFKVTVRSAGEVQPWT
jgi:hypothetical protein